jgi:peptidoglycan/xylan/chitin deacetylase (PgdA/CDA1 family)
MNAETLRARREARRRSVRRRRLAVVLIGAIVAAVAVIVVANRSSGAPHSTAARTHAGAAGVHHGHSGATRLHSTVGAGAAGGRPGREPVPILMYHVIAAPPAGAPFPGLYVAPTQFAEQMQALKGAGWRPVTLDQVHAYWSAGVALPAGKPIVLTFDNGYQSQYTQALPVLRRLGWVADENLQLTGLPPSQGGLSAAQVRGLIEAGWEIDTQGFSHADLIALDSQQLHYEVAVARTVLQRRFQVPVNWFCYPSGHYDATVIAAVRAAGYVGSTTVVPGWAHAADDPFRLHRLRVLGGTTPEQLLAQIAAARAEPSAAASYNGA